MPSIRATSRSGSIERRPRARLALLAALLLAAIPGAGAARAAETMVRVAVMAETAPFSYRAPDGTLTGFNVEIMQALCRAMAAKCRFDELPFEQVLGAVAEGKYDYGLANFLRTPEREAVAAFSAPYWRSSSSFIGAPGDADKVVPDAVKGHRVVVIRSSRQQAYMKAMAEQLSAFIEVAHLSEVWQALREGRADFALVPTLAGLGFLVSPEGEAFSTVGTPLMSGGLGGTVHIVVPRNRPDLKTAVDEAIAAIRADGSYHEVNRRYFPFDVY